MSNDEIIVPQKAFCPFMPPVVVPAKITGQISVQPIPCLGPHDPIKGGGCAVYEPCQNGLNRVLNVLYALEETTAKAGHVE